MKKLLLKKVQSIVGYLKDEDCEDQSIEKEDPKEDICSMKAEDEEMKQEKRGTFFSRTIH